MLKELIDQFYLEQQRDKEQSYFYISDAGKCPRQIFFKFKNLPRAQMEPRILRIFERGEHMHRNIFNVLYRLKIGVATEVSIPSQEMISGRADAILSVNNENYVLDIKSMNSMIFRKLASPKEENVYQLQLYMHYFNVPKGILLYIDKDRQDIKEFIIDYNPGMASALLKNFEDLKIKIKSDIVPHVLSDHPRNWQCTYCQFKDICRLCDKGETNWSDCKGKIKTADTH